MRQKPLHEEKQQRYTEPLLFFCFYVIEMAFILCI